MPIQLTLFIKAIKSCYHFLRENVYNDMSHQASDWIPEERRTHTSNQVTRPIKLDFNIPKKNRLHWIQRTIR